MPARTISSSQNWDIRRLKALRDRRDIRHAERLFVVEGPRFVLDASRSETPRQLVLAESALPAWSDDWLPGIDTIIVPDRLFADVSSTQSPQGVLAVFAIADAQPIRPAPQLTIVADGVQDPGNLGTMIRSAAANGASQLLYTPGTVDPYNPKVVRSAAGSHVLVAITSSDDLVGDLAGSIVYIAEGVGGIPVDEVDWSKASAVLIGSEARGPGSVAHSLEATVITIPMLMSVDSLNAGVAASIILYEAFRQRRQGDRTGAASLQ